jgi:hypothetical protein
MDFYLAKTDENGTLLWENYLGTLNYDYPGEVCETADGGFVVTGYTMDTTSRYYLYLAKTDSNGTLLWSRLIGNGTTKGYGLDITDNGEILVTGNSQGSGTYRDIYLARTDAEGNVLWEKTYSGGGNSDDTGYSVRETSSGDAIIAGAFYDAVSGSVAYILRTDPSGNKIWGKAFQRGHVKSIYQNSDGTFIACGSTSSIGAGSWDAYLLKTDANGTKVWEKTFGKAAGDYGHGAIPTLDGGIAVLVETGAGITITDAYVCVVKTNSLGVQQWARVFGTSGQSIGRSLIQRDNSFVVAGSSGAYKSTRSNQFYLVRIDGL